MLQEREEAGEKNEGKRKEVEIEEEQRKERDRFMLCKRKLESPKTRITNTDFSGKNARARQLLAAVA